MARDAALNRTSRWRELWPLAIAGLGVLLRLRLPEVLDEALPMKKAFEMWGWSRGHLTLDPGTAGWPSLSFYVHLLLQHLDYGLGRLTGTFVDRNDYFVAAWPDLRSVARLAHALDIAAAGGVIWAGARLAQQLAGRAGLLLTGLLLAFSPLLIDYSQLVTPDILVALFVALAVTRMVAIQQRGRARDYAWAGVWIGLGISTKYTPVLMLPALFAAHGLRSDLSGRPWWWALADRRPWLATIAAILAFVATSPYLLLDIRTLGRDLALQTAHMTSAHFGQEAQGWLYYPGVLASGLGWSGLLTCLVGLAWSSGTSRGPWLVLTACVAPFYLGLSTLATHFDRYMVPLLMPLAVGASGLLGELGSTRWLRPGAARTGSIALVMVVALAPEAFHTWRARAEKLRPSTHELADRFLREAAGPGEPHIAAEALSVTVPAAQKADRLDDTFVGRLTPRQRSRLRAPASYQVDFIPMTAVRPEQTALYYDLRHYTPYRFIVLSQATSGRYLVDPDRFPAHLQFYRDLDRYGSLAWRTGSDRGARGTEIRIYRLLPDSAAALIRDRGPLDLHRMVATAGPIHMPTFARFIEGVAGAGLARGEWSVARSYYTLLWETGARAGFSEEERAALGRLIADLAARSPVTTTRDP